VILTDFLLSSRLPRLTQRREGMADVYAERTLSDTRLWSRVEALTASPIDTYAALLEHVCRVGDADLRTQCTPRDGPPIIV
jgi:hypothetical protein